ncbi:migration and invasion enhancer 1 [Drosophila innubila]|uniref:migration and invasion enhancer 1 n=1 Tax=Drosophila innubila TaxID=198719 RepID=UPI00148CE9B9|nr:migration and invasion enhancer 1 [Drosophila innubila]
MVNVDVEYCGVCNFALQCHLLRQFLVDAAPDVQVSCHQGRRGSFEVKIDDQLVHSKLSCLAFPQHESVLTQVQRAQRGESLQPVKEAPIKDCSIM